MKESRCTFSAIGLPEEGSFIVMGGFNNTPLSNCEMYKYFKLFLNGLYKNNGF